MQPKFKYHVFIAHAGNDSTVAKKIYHLLVPRYEVFLDSETLKPGDNWNKEIPKAQRESLITVVIVTHKTEKAYFEQEEIMAAIELSRSEDSDHRVVPVYIGHLETPIDIPYGLRQLHAIFVKQRGGIKEATVKIQKLLKQTEKLAKNPNFSEKIIFEKEKRVLLVEDKISHIISEFSHCNLSIIIVFADIDNFTAINNKYGTEVGDNVLQIIRELFSNMSSTRYTERIFGDEFVACLVGINDDLKIEINDLIKRVNKYPWTTISPELYVTVSVGVTKRKPNDPIQRLLLQAVYGSILAKKLGGNRVEEAANASFLKINPETANQMIREKIS